VGVGLRVDVMLGDLVTVPLLLTDRVRVGEAVADQVYEARADAEIEREDEPELDGERLTVGAVELVLLTDRVLVGEAVADHV
jgi:hypothetical protein